MLRTYYIFTYGFTAIEENIIGKMLPDKKSVLVSTDCFTDLVACNSYAILIHAASVAKSAVAPALQQFSYPKNWRFRSVPFNAILQH